MMKRTGYGSHSAFPEAFGNAPGKRSAENIVTAFVESPLGALVAGATYDGVCLLEFTERRILEKQFETIRKRFRCAVAPGSNEHLDQLRSELDDYFAGKRRDFEVAVSAPGSEFQEKVWSALRKIPYGTTCTYEDLARAIGSPQAIRAVGTANGMNRIAIVIPCHRVINKGGGLGGYGGGIWRKQWLLDLEQSSKRLF